MKTPGAAAPSNRLGPAPGPAGSRRSIAKGDLPEAVLDRYLVERDLRGRPERFFRDHRAAEPMFCDRGRSLVSNQAYPDAVIDMLKIARHRGWDQVRVSGDPAFRREVWIQAQALGMEVQGHRPRERDRQAAGEPPPDPAGPRRAARPRRSGGARPHRRSGRSSPPDGPRPDPGRRAGSATGAGPRAANPDPNPVTGRQTC